MSVADQCHTCKIQSSCSFYNSNLINDEIAAALMRFHYNKGQTIFRQGNFSSGIYNVVNGVIKKTYTESNQNEVILEIASPGDSLGFESYLTEAKHFDYSSKSLTEAEVCVIPLFIIQKHFIHDQRMRDLIFRLTKQQLLLSYRLKLMVQNKNVKQRIAQILLYLMDKTGKDGESEFSLLSREDLATLSYTTSESVTRFLSELKKSEVVDFKGSVLKVLNPELLRKIAKAKENWHIA